MSDNEYTNKVLSVDFDSLAKVAAERIAALQAVTSNMDKTQGSTPILREAMCRDMIWPNIMLLVQFIDSVNVSEAQQ